MLQSQIIEIDITQNGVDCVTTEAMLQTLKLKSEQLYCHAKQVGLIVEHLGLAIGLNEDRVRLLKIAGYLHDLGKHSIPNHILNKPGPLTKYEWEQMHQHSERGAAALNVLPGFEEIAEVVLSHHEQDDGSGYPRALSGDEIPIMSKLIRVADTFSATSSERSYKPVYIRRVAIKAAVENAKFNRETTEAIQTVLSRIYMK